jgi:ribosomal protein S8
MTEPQMIDYGLVSYELFETMDKSKAIQHVTGWLEREGFIRQIGKNKAENPFMIVELTLSGRKLIESSDKKDELVKALKSGSIQVIASIIGSILT